MKEEKTDKILKFCVMIVGLFTCIFFVGMMFK